MTMETAPELPPREMAAALAILRDFYPEETPMRRLLETHSRQVAAMAEDRAVFDAMVKPMAKFLAESPSRVPFSDFYDTVTGCYERFIARSVQGGLYMPLLMDKWTKEA